mgnify:CR=1 FL=1
MTRFPSRLCENALEMEAILEVTLDEARFGVLLIECLPSDSSLDGISGDSSDFLIEDSTSCLPCLLKYLPNFSKIFGFSAINSAIRVMVCLFAG